MITGSQPMSEMLNCFCLPEVFMMYNYN